MLESKNISDGKKWEMIILPEAVFSAVPTTTVVQALCGGNIDASNLSAGNKSSSSSGRMKINPSSSANFYLIYL